MKTGCRSLLLQEAYSGGNEYEIHDKELFAVVAYIKEWDAELRELSDPFRILTDHINLRYFLTTRKLTER